jgi:serine/threonine-protein kinase
MRKCPICEREFDEEVNVCSIDGHLLDLLGVVLDEKYRLDEKIGEGGMGQVYVATHLNIGTRHAVKVLDPTLLNDPYAVERFRREARAASQLDHPNLVRVTDFGITKGTKTIYLVMELLEGESLKERLSKEEQLEHKEIINILNQTCSAVDAAHAKGIIHRDLKPDNVYLVKNENGTEKIKVLDFGIAKIVDSDKQGGSITETGNL